jgi:hypothetical protein
MAVTFPACVDWNRESTMLDDCLIVRLPLRVVWTNPVEIKPQVSVDILFGEYMSTFEVSISRLREIYDFVTTEVIPRFAGFFP